MDGMSLLTGECHWVEFRDATIESRHADIAQLGEQLICNQQVGGSSPSIGSDACRDNQQAEGSSTGTSLIRRISPKESFVTFGGGVSPVAQWPRGII